MVMDQRRRNVRHDQGAQRGGCGSADIPSAQLSGRWMEIDRTASTWTPCHLGGRRPWFICSARTNGQYCGRRVAMLYLVGELFACRCCCNLAYASQQKDPLIRNVARTLKIRARLGGSPDLFGPIPERPRRMWRCTYERHCAALARIEGNLFARPTDGGRQDLLNLASVGRNQRASKRYARTKFTPLRTAPARTDRDSVDHIVPYSRGGKTIPSNGQLAHRECNASKNAKLPTGTTT